MDSALLVHRLHFVFTFTFHYLFPQLTMGLAPLIVVLKTLALRRNDQTYHQAARFWARIFAINFVLGVVTGIPMEFQFGTNWSHFSGFAGGVIGQTGSSLPQARSTSPSPGSTPPASAASTRRS
jgi:cytochrome d ubiquinol oxidase subunit I